MTRRNIIRLLLSLLLLMSQQMAFSHAMTHWAGSRDAPANLETMAEERDTGVSSAFAQDQTCNQCLAFAQVAGMVASPTRIFVPAGAATCAPSASATQPGCTRTACGFQPRAPPSLA